MLPIPSHDAKGLPFLTHAEFEQLSNFTQDQLDALPDERVATFIRTRNWFLEQEQQISIETIDMGGIPFLLFIDKKAPGESNGHSWSVVDGPSVAVGELSQV